VSWRDGPWRVRSIEWSYSPWGEGIDSADITLFAAGPDVQRDAAQLLHIRQYGLSPLSDRLNMLAGVDLDDEATANAIHDWLIERGFKPIGDAK
jgi:hypothetical protein